MDIIKYKNKYIHQINLFKNNKDLFPEHKIYEMLWALESEMIIWDDIPPNFKDEFALPSLKDNGIDLISLDYSRVSQVKKYGENSTINFTDISTFYCYANGILNITDLSIHTTNDSKLVKFVDCLIQKKNINLQRKSFKEMLDNIGEEDIEDNKIITNIEQRDYLIEATKLFLESEKKDLLFQLPCGTGKSFIIFNIISIELQKNSENKFIIFCPWIDLATQMFEQITNLGIVSSLICTGKRIIKKGTKVIICVNRSVEFIPEIYFKYKFIDEAHHLEDETSVIKQKIDKIKAEKTLRLSATFHSTEKLDYNFPMDIAIEKGYISDYIINVEYLTKGDKMKSIIDLVKNNMDWSPMFVYFNSVERIKIFYDEIKKNGINCDYLFGEDTREKKNSIKDKIENGEIQVLALCGMYNEGISIDCLQTIIFGDLRYSEINRMQIAMRANRIYHSKPYYRLVLPLCESEFDEDDIQDLIKTFSKIDQRLKKSIMSGTRTKIKIRKDGSNLDVENAELLREKIFTRFGEIIGKLTTFEKSEELLEYVEKHGIHPKDRTDVLFSDDSSMTNFWQARKNRQDFDYPPYVNLLKNPILKKNNEEYLLEKEKNRDIEKIPIERKVDMFLKYVLENQKIPKEKDDFDFGDNTSACKFWQTCRLVNKFKFDIYAKLLDNEILKEDYDKYLINLEKKTSTEEKIELLLEFVKKNNRYPIESDKDSFRDGTRYIIFWKKCKIRCKLEADKYKKLYENPILRKNYEEYYSFKEIKLSLEEKSIILLEFVKKNNRIPTESEKIKFDDGTFIHCFWRQIKRNKIGYKYPILMDNKILFKNYNGQL